MIVETDPGRDVIVGGRIFTADKDGKANVPDDLAIKDGLMKSQADDPEREALVDQAIAAGVKDAKTGKPVAPSTMRRWDVERLKAAIAEAGQAAAGGSKPASQETEPSPKTETQGEAAGGTDVAVPKTVDELVAEALAVGVKGWMGGAVTEDELKTWDADKLTKAIEKRKEELA